MLKLLFKLAVTVMVVLTLISLLLCGLVHHEKGVEVVQDVRKNFFEIKKIPCDDDCILFDDFQDMNNKKVNKK